MSGSAARPGRAGLLVGVSVTGLPDERAAAVAVIGAGTRPPARVWRHSATGAASGPGSEPAAVTPVEVLPAVVGVRLSQLLEPPAETPAGASALVLPICFYRSAALALCRLGEFVAGTLGLRLPDGTRDTELRDLGITSDQALDDWLGAAAAAGFRAVALWPVAFADPGVGEEEFTAAARHAVQVAAQATSVLG